MSPVYRNIDLRLIDKNRAVTMGLARGAVIHCVLGTLWITEEGRYEDVILEPGQHFEVCANARIVITAMHGPAIVGVVLTAVGRRLGKLPDLHSAIHDEALRLRREETGALVRSAFARLRALFGRLVRAQSLIASTAMPKKCLSSSSTTDDDLAALDLGAALTAGDKWRLHHKEGRPY